MLQNLFFTTLRGVSRSCSLRVDITSIKEVTCYERRFMVFERNRPYVLALLQTNRSGFGLEWNRYRYACKKTLEEDMHKIYNTQNDVSRQVKLIKTENNK